MGGGKHHFYSARKRARQVAYPLQEYRTVFRGPLRGSLSQYGASFSAVHHLARGLMIGCTTGFCTDLGRPARPASPRESRNALQSSSPNFSIVPGCRTPFVFLLFDGGTILSVGDSSNMLSFCEYTFPE